MVGAATAEAHFRSRALGTIVRSLSALRTTGGLTARGAAIAEAVTFKASEWIRNEDANCLAEPAIVDLLWEQSGIECEHQQVSVSSLTVFESGDASDVSHTISLEIRQNLLVIHVSKFRGENGALARVATLVERHGHLFPAESGDL